MSFINETGILGIIVKEGTQNVTGSIVATLFLLLVILLVLSIVFGIPFEFFAVLVLPFCISVGAFYSNFLGPLIVIIIYIGMLIAKNWAFKN